MRYVQLRHLRADASVRQRRLRHLLRIASEQGVHRRYCQLLPVQSLAAGAATVPRAVTAAAAKPPHPGAVAALAVAAATPLSA